MIIKQNNRHSQNNGLSQFVLVVIDGPFSGAEKTLALAAPKTIGTSMQSDISLHDPLSLDYQIEAIAGRAGIILTLLVGEATWDNKQMEAGIRYKTAVGTPVRLGHSTFVFKISQQGSMSDEEAAYTLDALSPDKSKAQVDTVATLEPSAKSRAGGSFTKAVSTITIGSVLLLLGVLALRSGASDDQAAVAPSVSIEELVRQSGVPHVKTMQMTSGRWVVKGIVSNEKEQALLEQLLSERNEEVLLKTSIGTNITNAVRELYRINGLTAKIVSNEPGHVLVKTESADLDLLRRIETAVRLDVPDLITLRRENLPPKAVVEQPGAVTYTEIPGKKVMLVVTGAPSYVVTEDRSRYFKGAILPTGHIITSISESTVTLTKNGKTSDLNF